MVTIPKKTSIIASVLVIFAVVTATSLVSIAVESHQAFAWGDGGWGWGGPGWGGGWGW